MAIRKIGFGGGCHWCTEAVFASLKGVLAVDQGWITELSHDFFSEAVTVTFDDSIIPLETLMEIHLYTHSSTANHSMRAKYRSAVYVFSEEDRGEAIAILDRLKKQFKDNIITEILYFGAFKRNRAESLDYYYTDPGRPFCENYINPKLQLLMRQFSGAVDFKKLGHLMKDE
ncbi:MAG: peptide methionine sulfoxide reductase [Chitinophagaceae bacterium]|nr:MAG: peptide methionine sulfoxide reductase [Chitinophagaceae bacterium]